MMFPSVLLKVSPPPACGLAGSAPSCTRLEALCRCLAHADRDQPPGHGLVRCRQVFRRAGTLRPATSIQDVAAATPTPLLPDDARAAGTDVGAPDQARCFHFLKQSAVTTLSSYRPTQCANRSSRLISEASVP